MDPTIKKIIESVTILFVGYFLRDLYIWLKKLLVPKKKPKIFVEYTYNHKSTTGTYPRNYEFKSHLVIHNIDSETIYNVKVYKYENNKNDKIEVAQQVSLKSDDKIIRKDKVSAVLIIL